MVVILNPVAGRGRGIQLQHAIEQALPKFRIIETRHSGHARQLAEQCAKEGHSIIVAAGGDGTLSDVIAGCHGTETTVGILPCGTGNDVARHFGIHKLEHALHVIAAGNTELLDLGWVNGRPFVNIVGCGFDAQVAQQINSGFRHLRGTTAYIAAVLKTLVSYRAVPLTLTLDEEVHHAHAMLCAVANSTSYGGGMRVAPMASMQDGLLDVIVVEDLSKLEFLRAFPKVFKGSHLSHPKVKQFRATTVKIASDQELPVLSDGELIGTTPVNIHIEPNALRFFVPKSSQ